MTEQPNYAVIFRVASFVFFVLAALAFLAVLPIPWVALALLGVACYVLA